MKQSVRPLSAFCQPHGKRQVVAKFDGGNISSDGGGILLRELEERTGILRRFGDCFTDFRDQARIEHSLQELVNQRVYGLALGYEDLNDHDRLRSDPLLALLAGKEDPTGNNRHKNNDKGKPLAGKSTLNRFELGPDRDPNESRYKKIVLHPEKVDQAFVDLFLASFSTPPERIVLDVDATDDPVHGHQEGRFFHGYYREYCYLPLYIFCGDHLLCARLQTADRDPAAGLLKELEPIVTRIRERWPQVEIILRGDSGFCRDPIMSWCEENHVHYLFGLAKNSRLENEISQQMTWAQMRYWEGGLPSRIFKDFNYKTRKSWSHERRVVGKAEYLSKGANPRFVVTSLSTTEYSARDLYVLEYCARGEMENRIKEKQLCLFADRLSTSKLRSNQTRLYFSSIGYVLMRAFREIALHDTELAKAQSSTIRVKLFKIGAKIRMTFRKVWISLSESSPMLEVFIKAIDNIRLCRQLC